MRVLIVDGSKQRRQVLVETLGELTNVVIQGAVGDVRTALLAVADASPDIVVTGTLLPDGDGTHLIERIRQLRSAPPTVVVTSVTTHAQRDRYLAAGADRCVENEDELKSTVASLARTRRAAGSIPPAFTLELLGRMTAAVVHDLNNYVGVLEVMLALLRRHPHDEALWGQAHAALAAVRRLDDTLLDYARGGTPEPTRVELGALVRDMVALAGRVIPSTVQVVVELDPEGAMLRAVRSELEQLVLNLVVNACDAMPAGGELRISVGRATAAVLLEVADTGIGMQAGTSKHPGSGLGLGIVQAVVDRYRGAIRIVSRPEGGTLVAILLPRQS